MGTSETPACCRRRVLRFMEQEEDEGTAGLIFRRPWGKEDQLGRVTPASWPRVRATHTESRTQ